MKKIQVRCYKTLANVYSGIYNYEVYYLVYEGWSNYTLATCINCGELFTINWENPKTKGLSISEIADSYSCPKCNSSLKDKIKDYPKNIKLTNGQIGSFTPTTLIPPDKDSLILEVFEIKPQS